MFISRVDEESLEERLDPAFYAPLPLETDAWLDSLGLGQFDYLGSIASVVTSAFYKGIANAYADDGIAFIRVGDVKQGTIDLTRVVRLPYAVATSTEGLAWHRTPLLVLTKGGSVGRVGAAFGEEKVALSRPSTSVSAGSVPLETAEKALSC